jgi:hypothetical protein
MADPTERMAAQIRDLQRVVQELVTRPAYVPILNTAPSADYTGNVWMYPDGKLNMRMKDGTIKQVALAAPSAPTTTNPTPAPQPVTHTGTWRAVWGQAYRQAGGVTGGNDQMLYHGDSGESSYNGLQKSLIGFPYATIATALSGSTIKKCEFWIYQVHTYWNNGGTQWVGAHSNASQPGSYGGVVHEQISSFHVNPGQASWHTVSTEFGSRLRDGSAKGVLLTAPTHDRTYYGYAHGGSGTPTEQMPMLRITYVK